MGGLIGRLGGGPIAGPAVPPITPVPVGPAGYPGYGAVMGGVTGGGAGRAAAELGPKPGVPVAKS
jgi:hypothetical protein